MLSRCSLYVGTRSSQPSGVIIEHSRCSSACAGTCDWMKITDFSGSSPAASQSSATSIEFSFTREVSA